MTHAHTFEKWEIIWTHLSPPQCIKESEEIPQPQFIPRTTWDLLPSTALVLNLLCHPCQHLGVKLQAQNSKLGSLKTSPPFLPQEDLFGLMWISHGALLYLKGSWVWSQEQTRVRDHFCLCVCGGGVLKSFLYLNARNPASSVLFIEGFFLTLVLDKITFSEHSYNCPVWESYTLEILQRHVVLEGIWRCSSLLLLLFLLHLHISITNIIILHCVNEAPYFLKVSSLHFSYHRNSGDKPVGIE